MFNNQLIYAIALYRVMMRMIFGYEFMCVVYPGGSTKYSHVHHCVSLQDAVEWMSSEFNDSKVVIIDRSGYFVAQRG